MPLNSRNAKPVRMLLAAGWLCLSAGAAPVAASDCVGFENMAVKILRQEYGRVHFALNADLINACARKVNFVVDLQYVDARGVLLDNLLKPVQSLSPRQTKTILYMESLPPEVFHRIGAYVFKASDVPESAQILDGNGLSANPPPD